MVKFVFHENESWESCRKKVCRWKVSKIIIDELNFFYCPRLRLYFSFQTKNELQTMNGIYSLFFILVTIEFFFLSFFFFFYPMTISPYGLSMRILTELWFIACLSFLLQFLVIQSFVFIFDFSLSLFLFCFCFVVFFVYFRSVSLQICGLSVIRITPFTLVFSF